MGNDEWSLHLKWQNAVPVSLHWTQTQPPVKITRKLVRFTHADDRRRTHIACVRFREC